MLWLILDSDLVCHGWIKQLVNFSSLLTGKGEGKEILVGICVLRSRIPV